MLYRGRGFLVNGLRFGVNWIKANPWQFLIILFVLLAQTSAFAQFTEINRTVANVERTACRVSTAITGPIGFAIGIAILVVTGLSIMMGSSGAMRKIAFGIGGIFFLVLTPTVMATAFSASC